MPDKQIIDLPALDELKDTDYLVVGRPSAPEPAQKMQGAQLAAFVDKSAQPHVKEAAKQAQAAAASAQTANTKASEASQSATQAQKSQQAIENMGVSVESLPPETPPEVVKSIVQGVVNLLFKIPQGRTGRKGDIGPQGVSIDRIEKTAGDGSPGTNDTYTIYLDNGTSYPFQVLNGPQGPQGNGLTIKFTYDTLGELEAAVPVPELGMNAYIGTTQPYDVYSYTQTDSGNRWVNGGKLQGPEGQQGPAGANATINGVNALTLTAAGGLSVKQIGSELTIDGSDLQSKEGIVTLTTSNWSASGSRFKQTVQVSGVSASTAVVIVDVHLTGDDLDADNDALSAWLSGPSMCNVEQGDGTLTFYSAKIPTQNIPVKVGVC